MDKMTIKKIRDMAKEGRSFVNIDTECPDGMNYAEEISPVLKNIEGVKIVKIAKGFFITDFKVCYWGGGDGKPDIHTNENEHAWIVINDEIILDVGSDEFNDSMNLGNENKKIEIIELKNDTRHKPVEFITDF
jgi:hypothetical protein